jgi:phosphatidylserine/phosphatidylglycerophosphate/cardiolipin synthase-like enzyme
MHNKFCVIDGIKVSSGSMNPTDNCANKNNNNLLLISSKMLSENYETEFLELWTGTFKKGIKVKNSNILFNDKFFGEIIIQNYFCPDDDCADKVKLALTKAKSSIFFMTFSFTHQEIANVLMLKKLENISIIGVMELKQISQYSRYEQMLYNGINVVKDGNKYNLHHKVFIIDNETVITGSFNPTSGGNEKNDENVLIIKNKVIAEMYLKEFEKVMKEAETEN